jgi:hypothetical protein
MEGDRSMAFDTSGFLSPALSGFRETLRSVPTYRVWFEFSESLNRLGLELLRDRDVPLQDSQRVTIAGLFVRAHKSFQAALTLCEIGLTADARVVLRGGVEGAIALNALADDATFLDRLKEAHYFNRRKVARLVLSNPNYRKNYSTEEIKNMESTVKEADDLEVIKGSKLSEINWADVALKHCKDLYELLYRSLSSDGTHTTITSVERSFDYDANGKITAVKVGPDLVRLVETLKAACLMFLWAADPFARAFDTTFRPEIQRKIE